MCAKKAVQSAEYNLDFDRFITEIFYNNKKNHIFSTENITQQFHLKYFLRIFLPFRIIMMIIKIIRRSVEVYSNKLFLCTYFNLYTFFS